MLRAYEKSAQLVYRALSLHFPPDARRVVDLLRDISIVTSFEESVGLIPASIPQAGGQVLGYVGIFEDGWLSDDARIVARVGVGVRRARFIVDVDPALLSPATGGRRVAVTDSLGQLLGTTTLVAGSNVIDVVAPISGRIDVRLLSNGTMPLPGGDGRLVAGRLVATVLE